MIELGLQRISRLLKHTPLPWKAIHVAGTNGKGSICAYASAMLHAGGDRCGRFTSPHLIDRWDYISINERPVKESIFRQVEERVLSRNREEDIKASEFELLTAIAFEIFTQEKVQIGVVEVGMGGRLDATNVLESPLVTIISKIGLDHQAFLGNTVEEIAREKAGILKPRVPCVVDGTNEAAVLKVLLDTAKSVGSGPLRLCTTLPHIHLSGRDQAGLPNLKRLEKHQKTNLSCAYTAVREALKRSKVRVSANRFWQAANRVQWPGRLQDISIEPLTGREERVLLDGAHNAQSASVLASYVDRHLRRRARGSGVTWVLAATQGKDIRSILQQLIHPEDRIVAIEFGPVDGMPWVKPMSSQELTGIAMEAVQFDSAGHPENHVEGTHAPTSSNKLRNLTVTQLVEMMCERVWNRHAKRRTAGRWSLLGVSILCRTFCAC